jgi:ribose 5-phosphate isomerase RpiB
MRVNTWSHLTGIVKRLEDTLHAFFMQCPIHFRESQVKTNQQGTFDTVKVNYYKMIARRVMLQVALGTESFIVTIDNLSLGIDQV